MKVTIAICTRNRCESLRHTLDSLSHVIVPDDCWCEVIIVDNLSTDRTREVVQASVLSNMCLRYVLEPHLGQSHARNTALAAAQGDIILFTDDDVQPPSNWVEAMCAPILSGKGQAVAGGVKIAPHLERPWMTPQLRRWMASTEDYVPEGPSQMVGANFGFSREVLSKVPQFDTELGPGALGFYDETLFSFQLSEAGYRLATVFEVAAEHHFDESRLLRSSFLDSAKKKGRSLAYVAHHWRHIVIDLPYRELGIYCLQLLSKRIRCRQQCLGKEGAPEWEMNLVLRVHYCRQYLLERKRQRNYDKFGLRKRTPPSSLEPGMVKSAGARTSAQHAFIRSVRASVIRACWPIVAWCLYNLAEISDYFF